MSKEKCLFQHVAVLKLCFIRFGNGPSGAHSTQSQEKGEMMKNKNNKTLLLRM